MVEDCILLLEEISWIIEVAVKCVEILFLFLFCMLDRWLIRFIIYLRKTFPLVRYSTPILGLILIITIIVIANFRSQIRILCELVLRIVIMESGKVILVFCSSFIHDW
jgi:hypothetical protein